MSIIQTREQVHKLIDESDDHVINAVYALLKSLRHDEGEETDLETYNREIDEAIKEVEGGAYITHQDAVKQLRK